MRGLLHRFFRWLAIKSMPPSLAGGNWTGPSSIDSYRKNRAPTPNELMAELKGIAWACASLNASVCANNPPSLYVVTRNGEPSPKCAVRPLPGTRDKAIRCEKRFEQFTKAATQIDEVTAHPLLELLNRPNPYHGSFDLWELTTLYQEVHGTAFWSLDLDPVFGVPCAVYVLPSQNVTPMRSPDSPRPIDYFRYRTGRAEQTFDPAQVVFFKYPDPRDPYTSGLSPLRAAFEQVSMASEYAASRRYRWCWRWRRSWRWTRRWRA